MGLHLDIHQQRTLSVRLVVRALSTGFLPRWEVGAFTAIFFWHLYASWDHRYANPNDTFNTLQSVLNVVELTLGVGTCLFFPSTSDVAAKILIFVSICTMYKTVIYFGMEIASGMEYTQHNHWSITLLVAAVSFPWILYPGLLAKAIMDRMTPSEKNKSN